MNRTVLLLIVFLILAGATAIFMMGGDDKKAGSSTLGEDRNFAVPAEDIQKIFIADREGSRTTLVRQGDGWIYNGKYPAKPNAVENVLDAITRVRVRYKPADAAVDNMIRSLATEGIKVEIYGKGDELLKAYYVGGAPPDERGTYMILEGAEQPYVAEIPSWEGNLRFRFSITGKHWRDETIFDYDVEDIESVSVEYPKQRNKSFVLESKGADFSIKPFYEITPVIEKELNQGLAESFLIGFDNFMAEGFENDNPGRDSISDLIPFTKITVTPKSGTPKTLSLFPIYPQKSGIDKETGEEMYENIQVERYFADCSNGDFFLVQNRTTKRFLWAYDSFFE
jgi:hypothetical protein